LFSYIYAWHEIDDWKNAPPLLAISMAMRIRQYGAERIAQYGRYRATLDATGRRHWSSIRPAARRPGISSYLAGEDKSTKNVPATAESNIQLP